MYVKKYVLHLFLSINLNNFLELYYYDSPVQVSGKQLGMPNTAYPSK